MLEYNDKIVNIIKKGITPGSTTTDELGKVVESINTYLQEEGEINSWSQLFKAVGSSNQFLIEIRIDEAQGFFRIINPEGE